MRWTSFFLGFCVMSFPVLGIADFYQIQDIFVQATSDSPKQAKSEALNEAQQRAFSSLMRRMVGQKNPFVDHLPEVNEIEAMVQDLSLKNEKNTATDYWADVDVQFKKGAVEEFLTQKKVSFLKKAPPVLLVVPVVKSARGMIGLEESNPVYQFLNKKTTLSDFYDLKLLSGDLDEIVAVNQYLKTQDVSLLNEFLSRYEADGIFLLTAEAVGENNWRMTGDIFVSNEAQKQVAFDWYQGYSIETAWDELLKKMEKEVREKEALLPEQNSTYYARLNETSLAQWVQDKKRLENLKFIKDVLLQGIYKNQMLVSFSYEGKEDEIFQKWHQAGWTWQPDFMGTSGTLIKGEVYE